MQPILEVKNLCVSAGLSTLVRDISFTLFSGECLALIGESGSGKTTIAQTFLQLQEKNLSVSGEILFEGHNLLLFTEKDMEKIRARKIGMVFQDPATSLNPTMKIEAQITESIRWHDSISKEQAHQKALELLEMVDIDNPELRASQYPYQLSGGMKQRVLIAMALACEPRILIADEPTSALDITTQFHIITLLKNIQLKRKFTILFITHDLNAVAQFCDRAIIMNAGELVEEGSVEKLFKAPQHLYTHALLEASYVR